MNTKKKKPITELNQKDYTRIIISLVAAGWAGIIAHLLNPSFNVVIGLGLLLTASCFLSQRNYALLTGR